MLGVKQITATRPGPSTLGKGSSDTGSLGQRAAIRRTGPDELGSRKLRFVRSGQRSSRWDSEGRGSSEQMSSARRSQARKIGSVNLGRGWIRSVRVKETLVRRGRCRNSGKGAVVSVARGRVNGACQVVWVREARIRKIG